MERGPRTTLRDKFCGVNFKRADPVAQLGQAADHGGKVSALVAGDQPGHVFKGNDAGRKAFFDRGFKT